MSVEMLKEQIQEFGIANAIVVLNPKIIEFQESVKQGARAMSAGQMPSAMQDVLTELSSNFHPGFLGQGNAVIDDIRKGVNTGLEKLSRSIGHTSKPQRAPMTHFPYLGVVYGALDFDGLQALQEHDAVDDINHAPQLSLIQPEEVADSIVDGPPAEITWGLQRMHAPQLWEKGYTGNNIVVAHLDTGADSQHPTLADAIEHRMVFDEYGEKENLQGPFRDSDTHGTHTAATIAGRQKNGAPIIGMAPDAMLASCTVITGGDTVRRVLGGMNWAIEAGARILSMSLGFKGWNGSFEPVMQKLRAQQLLPIIAIGNDGPDRTRSPGNYGNALSVGAVEENDQVWGLSSSQHGERETGPVICAPGVGVWSATPGGGYKKQNGTSMATPHVAGLAALLLSAVPSATIDQLQEAILASCENPAGEDGGRIGSGIPNGLAALKILSSM